jgi:hypothetical protein
MHPGEFDRKVSFCTVTSGKTNMGGAQKVYTAAFEAWMSRKSAGQGAEAFVTQRLVVPVRYIYRGHYRPEINETYQIVDAGEKFNILSVDKTGQGLYIEILAEKITE